MTIFGVPEAVGRWVATPSHPPASPDRPEQDDKLLLLAAHATAASQVAARATMDGAAAQPA